MTEEKDFKQDNGISPQPSPGEWEIGVKFLLPFLACCLCLNSCSSIKKALRNWLTDGPSAEENVIPNSYELDGDVKIYHERHQELLKYLSEKKSPAKGWRLKNLRFIPDSLSTDSGTYLLSGRFVSRSRYNPKFDSPGKRHVLEWKAHGHELLQSWVQVLPELITLRVGIQLSVAYKYKNYLRPNNRLKEGVLTYSITAAKIEQAGQNPDLLYKSVLQDLKQIALIEL